jgi:hypothetical protein
MIQEWRERLRSSLHPFLFAAVYRVTALAADYLSLEAATRAELLLAAPKILQACFAATTDYFIWKLATKAYGKGSKASSAAVRVDYLLALLDCSESMAMVLFDEDTFEFSGDHTYNYRSLALAFAQ